MFYCCVRKYRKQKSYNFCANIRKIIIRYNKKIKKSLRGCGTTGQRDDETAGRRDSETTGQRGCEIAGRRNETAGLQKPGGIRQLADTPLDTQTLSKNPIFLCERICRRH